MSARGGHRWRGGGLVGKRSALLQYLAREDRERYLEVIGKLGLRK